jgi:ATP-binding cassette subfamily F protein 3
LLDEPTNHLDLDMRRSLALALQSYAGALVIVSHDRHLIATCADRILLVADGKVSDFDGDLDDYRQLRLKEERGARKEAGVPKRRDLRRGEAEARARKRVRTRPLEKQLGDLEARIAALTREAEAVRAALADPAAYAEDARDRLRELMQSDARLSAGLAEAEEAWLHTAARLDALRKEEA